MPPDFPTLILEIAFASDPGDEAPTWTDVSPYLRNVSVTRGRQRELDRYQAGRATFVLDNRSRRFDPEYGANVFSSASGAQDATFEGGIGGWTADLNCSVASSSVQAKSGTSSLRLTVTSGTSDAAAISPSVAVVSGQELTGIISSRAAGTGRDIDLRFLWYDVDGVQITDSVVGTFTDAVGSWTAGTVTATAPAGAAEAVLQVNVIGPSASEVHYFDEAGILRYGATWEMPLFYAGRVLPMKRIRLRATYNAVTYPIFDGFVDSWDQQYQPPREAVAVVDATDGFKAFAAAGLASALYTQEVRGDGPQWWFRLGESAGAATVSDSTAAIPGTVVGSVTFGQEGLAGDSDTAATMATTGGIRLSDSRAFVTGVGPSFTIEALIKTTEAATRNIWEQNGTDSCQLRFRMLSTGVLEFQVSSRGLVYTAETESTPAVNDGNPHHVAATYSDANDLRVWVDGTNVSNVIVTDTGSPDIEGFSGAIGNNDDFVVNGWGGTIDEVALYLRELSPGEIAAHASAALTPWVGDLSGARVENVLDGSGWPAALRDIDPGQSTLQAAVLGGSVLEHLQKVAESEFGELYMTADGLVRFEERSALVNQPSLATFGDSAAELPYADIDYEYSDTLIRNDITVSRENGAAQQVEDAASIKAFLRHSWTRGPLLHDSDELSRAAAEFFLAQYKDPLLRVSNLAIAPRRAPATLFPQVLGRDLTDRLTVVRRPQGVGAAISQTSVIEGIAHTIDASQAAWRTPWQLSPAAVGCFIEFDNGSGSAPCGFDDFAFAL